MKKIFVNIAKFSFSLGLGILLVWLSVRDLKPSDINEMRNAFKNVSWSWLIFGSLIGMGSNLVRAERWSMLLRSMGYKPKYANVAASVYIMYIGNVIFPRLGELSRCGIIYKTDNVPLEKSIGTMVVERAVDMLTLLAVGVVLFFLQYDMLYAIFDKYLISPLYRKYDNMSVISVMFLFTAVFFSTGFLFWIFKRFNFGIINVLKEKLEGLWYGLTAIRKLENPFLFIVYSLLIWVIYLLMGICTFKGIEATAHLGFNAGLVVLFFGTFAFIATQGGIGAYPIITREVLLLFGISANIGYAFGWIAWTLQTLFILIFGLGAAVYLVWNVKGRKSKTEVLDC